MKATFKQPLVAVVEDGLGRLNRAVGALVTYKRQERQLLGLLNGKWLTVELKLKLNPSHLL